MKKAFIVALGVLCTLTATAQNEGVFMDASKTKITDSRSVSDFERLEVNGPFDVKLVNDGSTTIKITGANNITPIIVTQVVNNTLSICLKDSIKIKPSKYTKVAITVPYKVLNYISMYGSGSITSKKVFNTNLKLKLNGYGSITLQVYSPSVNVEAIGAGHVTLSGYSENFVCRLTGSGSIKARELKTDVADVILMGCGDIKIASNKSIKGRINGSGSIAFGGEPEGQDLIRIGTGEFSAF